MAYLRRTRLEYAHQELGAAIPGDGTTVTDVAARWGYANLSRFTSSYRRAYGELPSHTLRGGPPDDVGRPEWSSDERCQLGGDRAQRGVVE
jgi:AraC-like DNA-binding protein